MTRAVKVAVGASRHRRAAGSATERRKRRGKAGVWMK
uniref:Uncharacterized protein n=1 Tax=Arundo donax TaxID=35708 RepID=A0A0A9AGQ2_ARUDO